MPPVRMVTVAVLAVPPAVGLVTTVHTVAVALVNITGLVAAPAVAARVKVPPTVKGIGVAGVDAKPVMAWLSLVILTVKVTCGAAA